jgi:hypothetical protein
MTRALALVVLFFLNSCAATKIDFGGGASLRNVHGVLRTGRVHRASRVEVDRAFEMNAAARALVVLAGDRLVLELSDDESSPSTTLYLSLDPLSVVASSTVGEDQLLSYAEVRMDDFRAVCKGGRGVLRISSTTGAMIAGELSITVSCRTYLDGYEREEASLKLSGPFRVET